MLRELKNGEIGLRTCTDVKHEACFAWFGVLCSEAFRCCFSFFHIIHIPVLFALDGGTLGLHPAALPSQVLTRA